MDVILLGTSAAYPTVERASSGYLVRNGDTNILVDMGSGVARNLLRWVDPRELSAIILSHLHQDHFIDIYPLYYYLAFHTPKTAPIAVYAPPGAREFVARILPADSHLDNVYDFKALDDRLSFTVDGITCESIAVRHNIPAFGLRLTGPQTVAYSSDTNYDGVLYEVAAESDIFICEATKLSDYKDVMHLTAAQAGEIAREANAKRLVLTHIWPDFDLQEQLKRAQEEYSGPIIIGEDNMRIELD